MFGVREALTFALVHFIPFYNNNTRFNIVELIDNYLSSKIRIPVINRLSVYVPVLCHQYVPRLLRSGAVEYMHNVYTVFLVLCLITHIQTCKSQISIEMNF